MTVGIVILAHTHLHRVKQLAKALASAQAKVMVHVDATVPDHEFSKFARALSGNKHIELSERVACEWGQFSLVEAGMTASKAVLATWPEVTHVVQISGSCLPVRPSTELVDFLNRHKNMDYVESVDANTAQWVIDGLAVERFRFLFPFSFQRQRALFDLSVKAQRMLGTKRAVPQGITPHLGSQWWCLSKKTLTAIIDDPDLPAYDAFFKKCWIPDESYIPTLVQKHSRNLVCRSLTLSRFDDQGKPHLFYDDHADLLLQTDHFFARKIWHGADKLYRRFLRKKRADVDRPVASEFGLDLLFKAAWARRCEGRPGRLTVGRFPAAAYQRQPQTCRPYGVLIGFSHAFDDLGAKLGARAGRIAHGRLYKKSTVQFAHGQKEVSGGVTANPKIRDHNPEQFLCNLLWNHNPQEMAFSFELSDGERMAAFVAKDPNARIAVLEGSWVLDLYRRAHTDTTILKRQAKRLARLEKAFEAEMVSSGRTDILRVALVDLINDRVGSLAQIRTHLGDTQAGDNFDADLCAMPDLAAFVQKLAGLGISTDSLGHIPETPATGSAKADGVAVGITA